jgi:hypothetical protein
MRDKRGAFRGTRPELLLDEREINSRFGCD